MQQQKIIGQPCPICQTLHIQGTKGVYCKTCYIQWKNNQTPNTPQPAQIPQYGADTGQKQPIQNGNDDIRANVALKMVSEIIAANKIEMKDWEEWANKFYNYTPNREPEIKADTGTEEMNTVIDNMPM